MSAPHELEADAAVSVERAADDVLAEVLALRQLLDDREARIGRLLATCDERQVVIDALQRACDERLALIERLDADLTAAKAAKPVEADDGVDWKQVALERATALARLSTEAERRAVLLAEVTAALRERTEEVEQLRRARRRKS